MPDPLIDIDVQMTGLRELEQELQALDDKLAAKILRQALYQAAKPMLKEARQKAQKAQTRYFRYRKKQPGDPEGSARTEVSPGTLKKSIRLKQMRGVDAGLDADIEAAVSLEVRSKAFYWHFLENGTVKMAAMPFLRPAFDEKNSAVTDDFADLLRKRIEANRPPPAADNENDTE